MTDLDLIAGLAPAAPLPGAARLAPARGKLVSAIMAERAAGAWPPAVAPAPGVPALPGDAGHHQVRADRPGSARRAGERRWRGRLAAAGTAAAALAAAAAGLLIATAVPGAHPAGPAATAAGGPARVHLDLTAATVLHRAAVAALRLPAGTPRPDQFVYVEWANGARAGHLFRAWLSVDGTRNGLIRSGGGHAVVPGCPPRRPKSQGCVPAPAYLPALPVTPAALLRYLEKTYGLDRGTGDIYLNQLGKTVDALLTFTYLRPQQRAALYEVLAQTPGFSVARHVTDVTGRAGVGVSWPFLGGSKTMIIFDPRSYAELGLTTWGSGQYRHEEFGRAVFKIAIVDRIGQLPPATRPG